MNALNLFIQQVSDDGNGQMYYNLFQLLNLPVCTMYCLWYGQKLKLGLRKTLLLLVLAFVAIYGWMLVLYWIFSGFKSFGGQNMVMVFVYVPIIALGLSRLLKIDWTAECYLHAGSLPLMHGVGHLGCTFAGCCRGYVSEWGLYNPSTEEIHFPIQLIEAVISITIAVVLIARSHRNNYKVDATQFPIMLVMYGFARFILEFFRDNEKLLLGCSSLAYHALFMLIVGIIWLILLKLNNKQSGNCHETQ